MAVTQNYLPQQGHNKGIKASLVSKEKWFEIEGELTIDIIRNVIDSGNLCEGNLIRSLLEMQLQKNRSDIIRPAF